jgi:hypothetical protein
MNMDSNIVKFPYGVSRTVQSRKPRRSKNGTPEERAAKAAQDPAEIALIANAKLWDEAKLFLCKLNVKKRLPEAVKCLQLLHAKNVSTSALLVRQRGASKSNALSTEEFQAKIERLDEYNRQYIAGYMQGLIDGRVT